VVAVVLLSILKISVTGVFETVALPIAVYFLSYHHLAVGVGFWKKTGTLNVPYSSPSTVTGFGVHTLQDLLMIQKHNCDHRVL